MNLEGAIDLHVHCAPDVRPRKMDSLALARAARDAGMRALLLKNHETSTTALAHVTEQVTPGIRVFGGLVLNEAVGGLNPAAVEMALRTGARQIWMPTHCAEGERAFRGKAGTGIALRPVPEILLLIADADAILGTAHLTPAETVELVAMARKAGVRKILITHPEIAFVDIPLEVQLGLAGPDVVFERCYVRTGFTLGYDGLAHSIRATGVAQNVLATDLGQPANPDPVTGLAEMRRELAARGFTDSELRLMMCDTPGRLLGLQ